MCLLLKSISSFLSFLGVMHFIFLFFLVMYVAKELSEVGIREGRERKNDKLKEKRRPGRSWLYHSAK